MKVMVYKTLYFSFILLAMMACEKESTNQGVNVGNASISGENGILIGGGNTCQPEFTFNPKGIHLCVDFQIAADESCYTCPEGMETKKLLCSNPKDVKQMGDDGKKACKDLGDTVSCLDGNDQGGTHEVGQIICVPKDKVDCKNDDKKGVNLVECIDVEKESE